MVSLNVAVLTNLIKRKRVEQYLKTKKDNVVCLQETYLKIGDVKLLKQVLGGKLYHAAAHSRSAGAMVGLAPIVPRVLMQKTLDKSGRYVILKG